MGKEEWQSMSSSPKTPVGFPYEFALRALSCVREPLTPECWAPKTYQERSAASSKPRIGFAGPFSGQRERENPCTANVLVFITFQCLTRIHTASQLSGLYKCGSWVGTGSPKRCTLQTKWAAMQVSERAFSSTDIIWPWQTPQSYAKASICRHCCVFTPRGPLHSYHLYCRSHFWILLSTQSQDGQLYLVDTKQIFLDLNMYASQGSVGALLSPWFL